MRYALICLAGLYYGKLITHPAARASLNLFDQVQRYMMPAKTMPMTKKNTAAEGGDPRHDLTPPFNVASGAIDRISYMRVTWIAISVKLYRPSAG